MLPKKHTDLISLHAMIHGEQCQHNIFQCQLWNIYFIVPKATHHVEDGGRSTSLWQKSMPTPISLSYEDIHQVIYVGQDRIDQGRASNDLLVSFASLYQTAHASSSPLLMAQFQEQKYNQPQHWPAVCVKNMLFMRVRPVSPRVMAKSNRVEEAHSTEVNLW